MKGSKVPSGESLSVRLTPDLVAAARELGRGSAAEGIRRALRVATRANVEPPLLSTVLRGAAFQAEELERMQQMVERRRAQKRESWHRCQEGSA